MTFDEGYGGKPDFLRGLTARGQQYVGEIPRSFTGWIKAPCVVTRADHARRQGRGRRVPRLASGSPRAKAVADLMNDPAVRDQPWQRWRVKDGEKGPVVWEGKHVRFHPKDENGLPGAAQHLLIARHVLAPSAVKFFISNAPANTNVGTLLQVAFSRWSIETNQADYPSRRRWVGTGRIGYHRRHGVARVSRVVSATPGSSHRRNRMSHTNRRRPAPPRA